jgi:hypothetical protein
MDLATHLHLVPKLRMSGTILSSSPYCFIACLGTALLYFAVFVIKSKVTMVWETCELCVKLKICKKLYTVKTSGYTAVSVNIQIPFQCKKAVFFQ